MRRATWWTGLLFVIGSFCFLVGPLPGFIQLVGSATDGTVFFVGSIFFTSAAFLQYLTAGGGDRVRLSFEPRSRGWWTATIQLAGTLYFNVDTFRAMQQSFDTSDVDRLVWFPEAIGSICFLISGVLAYREDRGRIAAVNLAGCVFFGISAVAGYVVPKTGDVLDLAAANWTTSLGALCFLTGAVMLMRSSSARRASGSAGRG